MEYGEILKDITFLIDHYESEYYNREDLRALLFDCIKGGTFFPVLYDISISSIFKFDTINHVKLVSIKGIYSFYVNGLCLLAIKDKKRICRGKLLALILWEDSHNREIKCDIFNFSISILN